MNEDLQKALAEFVKSSIIELQHGKDFVMAQAPDLIQQLIRWHYWQAWFSIAIEIAVIFGGRWLIKKLIPMIVRGNDPIWEVIIVAVSGFLMAVCALMLVFGDLPTIIQIHVAPKVWLLEWALSQVKGK